MGEREVGTIKFFNSDRFFGFIEIAGSEDVFMHGKDCLFEPTNLQPGVKVEFQLGEDKVTGKIRAEKIQLVEE